MIFSYGRGLSCYGVEVKHWKTNEALILEALNRELWQTVLSNNGIHPLKTTIQLNLNGFRKGVQPAAIVIFEEI